MVDSAPRYALYFVPPAASAFYRLGSAVVGYDCRTGSEPRLPEDVTLPSDWTALTAAPRRYGFHATLKAPFWLASDSDEAGLVVAVERFAANWSEAVVIEPMVDLMGDFMALVPRVHSAALAALAADCVTLFDRFRAPLTPAERRRRMRPEMSLRERANLDRWGYPYVLEDFRFHMTLTGQVPKRRQHEVRAWLSGLFATHCAGALAVDVIALLRQDHGSGRFRLLREYALAGGSVAPLSPPGFGSASEARTAAHDENAPVSSRPSARRP